MSFVKRFLGVTLTLLMVAGVVTAGLGIAANRVDAASSKTGTGLADHVLKGYREGWQYNYGSYGEFRSGVRATDCAGLIKSYLWWTSDSKNPKAGSVAVGGGASAMLNSASAKGTINYSDSSSLPRVHGLILYQPGHVGVYVGNNMAIDNRDYGLNIKYEKVFGRAKNKWTTWFKLPQINYPTTGWATFQGQKYYYENGEYIINTTRTIDGVAYSFGSDGIAKTSSGKPVTVSDTKPASTATTKKTTASSTQSASSQTSTSKSVSTTKATSNSSASQQAETAVFGAVSEPSSTQQENIRQQAKAEAERAIAERMAQVEKEMQTQSVSSDAEPSAESSSAVGAQTTSAEELVNLNPLGLAGKEGSAQSAVTSVPGGDDELIFSDGVIPKASAKATVFDAPKQVKGMNSILAILIVVAAAGLTAAIVIPRRIHLMRKPGYSSKKRVFRGWGFRSKKKK